VSCDPATLARDISLRVAVDLAPPAQQPFERRLQQVLAGGLAACQQHGRAEQHLAAHGEERLQLRDIAASFHPRTSPSVTSQVRSAERKG
jgi:hypothetical protein